MKGTTMSHSGNLSVMTETRSMSLCVPNRFLSFAPQIETGKQAYVINKGSLQPDASNPVFSPVMTAACSQRGVFLFFSQYFNQK